MASAKPAARAAQTELEWARQIKRAVKHVLLVIGNNPGRSLNEILARADVQQALAVPFQEAGSYTLRQVKKVWEESGGPGQSDFLNQLFADVVRNSVTAGARFHQAIVQGDRESIEGRLVKVGADLARRAGFSVRVAEIRGRTERDLLEIGKLGKKKRWVSKSDESTCSECKALHGIELSVLEPFPADAGKRNLRVYRDLLGPPRHPRCRCKLVPV